MYLLVGIQCAVDVVVDGLHDGLAVLEVGHDLEHVVEIVLAGVKRSQTRHLMSTFMLVRESKKKKEFSETNDNKT